MKVTLATCVVHRPDCCCMHVSEGALRDLGLFEARQGRGGMTVTTVGPQDVEFGIGNTQMSPFMFNFAFTKKF